MARGPRIQTPELIRHVMSRGNGRMEIFLDTVDYRQFVQCLGDVVGEFEIECWNYCLMPNHYHATLQPRRTNISEAIRQLNGVYAQWWNRRHGRVGHVFQGRFKDQIVDRDGYLLALSRYVLMNPVRARLVDQPEDWPWSSYRAMAGLEVPPTFLSVDSTLRLFGEEKDPQVLRQRFVRLATSLPIDHTAVDRIRSSDRILGTGEFKEWVHASASRPPEPTSISA